MTTAIEGPVVWRGDEHYETTRRALLWNALKPDRYPEAIVSVASEADVVEAVALARSRGLQVECAPAASDILHRCLPGSAIRCSC
jgi:hypothetical protein